jgi:hypothetical protein
MATDVEIASRALTAIGHESIASFSASGDKAQRWFHANYEMVKRELLREHQWRFATKRAVPTPSTIYDITGASVANPVVITIGDGHSIANGSTVYITGIVGMTQINNRTFTTANATGTTLQLSGENGSAYTAYSSGGTLTEYITADYNYRFPLPADCLRVLRVNDGEVTDYRVEGAYIFTNESAIDIEYVFDETTDSNFDAQFVGVLAARLAAEVSFYLTANTALTEQAWNIYNQKLTMARSIDSRQGMPRGIEASTWLDVRA